MSTLLIKNIHQLVTCDDEDRVLQNADIYCEDGFIKSIGTALDISADEVIDGMMTGYKDLAVVYSGDATVILDENEDMSF